MDAHDALMHKIYIKLKLKLDQIKGHKGKKIHILKDSCLTSFNVTLSFLKIGPNKSGVQAVTRFSSFAELYAITYNIS